MINFANSTNGFVLVYSSIRDSLWKACNENTAERNFLCAVKNFPIVSVKYSFFFEDPDTFYYTVYFV
jgi:hypothetical protein